MAFGFKKKMIDVGEMQKQGKVLPPGMNRELATNNDGFVEVNGSKVKRVSGTTASKNFSGMEMVNQSASSSIPLTQSTVLNRLDEKMKDLDRILYKLEQRVELLERKAGVGFGGDASSGESALGGMGGW
jgi:hypothetical protein